MSEIEILDVVMPSDWLANCDRMWITSASYEDSENGNPGPVEPQPRPLLHFTFDAMPEISEELENLFNLCNGPVRGFMCSPPLPRDHLQVHASLGFGTGAPEVYQLMIGRGVVWEAKYPIEASIIVYSDLVELDESAWELGDDGEITVTAPDGESVSATFEYRTAFMFTEQSLQTKLIDSEVQQVRSVTIRELFV